ncbi:hypothetical protein DXG01_012698 [Tephrocybe rancida]|nr:hypothetical protein DXG01_012698 [Tephrocybe rancida]
MCSVASNIEKIKNYKFRYSHPLFIIDFDLLKRGNEAEIDRLWEASTKLGFWYLKNHGVDDEVTGMFDMGAETMSLPIEEKMKFEQGNEGMSFGFDSSRTSPQVQTLLMRVERKMPSSSNVAKDDALAWPGQVHRSYPPSVNDRMGSTVTPFIRKSVEVNNLLLGVLNAKLGLPAGTLLEKHRIEEPSGSESRVTRTPPVRSTSIDPAIGSHIDFGSLSFLHNRLGGLQVLVPGIDTWQYVKPIKGHAICNVGDVLLIFSGGILRPNLHRVVCAHLQDTKAIVGLTLGQSLEPVARLADAACHISNEDIYNKEYVHSPHINLRVLRNMHLSSFVLTALAFSPIPATLADATTAGADIATLSSKSTNSTVTIFSNLPIANNARAIHNVLDDLKGFGWSYQLGHQVSSTILEEIQALKPIVTGSLKNLISQHDSIASVGQGLFTLIKDDFFSLGDSAHSMQATLIDHTPDDLVNKVQAVTTAVNDPIQEATGAYTIVTRGLVERNSRYLPIHLKARLYNLLGSCMMRSGLISTIALFLATPCLAATITLFEVATTTEAFPTASITVIPIGVGADGATTYSEEVIGSVYVVKPLNPGFVTSGGSVISTSTARESTFTSDPVTYHGESTQKSLGYSRLNHSRQPL